MNVKLKVPALEKLLDYVASGIGAIAGPMLAKWKASREAEALRISTQARADARLLEAKTNARASEIIAEAQSEARESLSTAGDLKTASIEIDEDSIRQRIEFQERKRQANIISVVQNAATELGDKEVADHPPDPDWTARFFDSVQDVSSEDLQSIWAKILSGEVETPGRTSLRTLSILRDMSQRDAQIFSRCAEYRILSFVLGEAYQSLTEDKNGSALVYLQAIGLMHSYWGVTTSDKLDSEGNRIIEYRGQLLLIEGPPETELIRDLVFSSVFLFFTQAGLELAKLCEGPPNLKYLAYFAKLLKEDNCTLKFAPIVRRGPSGRLSCNKSEFRVVEPAP